MLAQYEEERMTIYSKYQTWSIDSNLLTLYHKLNLRGIRTAFCGEHTYTEL